MASKTIGNNFCTKFSSKYSSQGFTLIEVLVAIGILSVVILGVSGMIAFYTVRMSEIRSEQDLRNDVGNILKSFSLSDSCNRHMKTVMGPYPAILSGLDYDFSEVEFLDGKISPGGPLPGHPMGVLHRVKLHIEGVPLPGQKIARGRIQIDYERKRPRLAYNPKRTRSQSIFFKLDASGRVIDCLDEKSYKQIELTQQVCERIDGRWASDYRCDLTHSMVARKATCEALGFKFSGEFCEI